MTQALIFGLDGATYHILDELVRRGVMPYLGQFMAAGARATLQSTVPPLTPIAWSNLVTGRTPGNHGITGFFQYESGESYALQIVTSRQLRAETLWSIVNRQGLRAGSLNFVVHQPPPRIVGYVIPGWVPWRWLKRFTHPRNLIDQLSEQLPDFDIKSLAMDFEQEKKSIAGATVRDAEEWIRLHMRRDGQWGKLLLHQLRDDPCELVGIVFDGVDKLQHLMWPYLDPSLEPEEPGDEFLRVRELCYAYFRQLDTILRETIAAVGPQCRTFVVSDHGFAGTSKTLYINTWLEREGYLAWKPGTEVEPDTSHELEPDFYQLSAFDMAGTRAFALTAASNGIHISVRGRRGLTGIAPGEYDSFRRQLKEALLTRCLDPNSGEPVVSSVSTREEVFSGPGMELAPDLILTLSDHGFISVKRSNDVVKKRKQIMGTHHPDGVFVAHGPGICQASIARPLQLIDIAPTVLYSLNLTIPSDLEGRVIGEIFAPAYVAAAATVGGRTRPTPVQPDEPEMDERDIVQRLKALGYME